MNNYTTYAISEKFVKNILSVRKSVEKVLDLYSPAFSQSERRFVKFQLDLFELRNQINDIHEYTCSKKDLRAFVFAILLLKNIDDTFNCDEIIIYFEKYFKVQLTERG